MFDSELKSWRTSTTTAITAAPGCHTAHLTRLSGEGLFSSRTVPEAFVQVVQACPPAPLISYIIFLVCHLYSIY